MKKYILTAAAVMSIAGPASANSFINGGFETGDATGWTLAGIDRSPYFNNQLTPALFTPGVDAGRSSVVNTAYVDPNLGATLGGSVYSGNYSMRVENTVAGGYASLLQQRVDNYTDANIFFAWKAVLLGAHGVNDAATMIISLTDLTTGIEEIHREYNAAAGGAGVDPRFSSFGSIFYTPGWQIEQLAIGPNLQGHNFLLSVIAADCEPTAHYGYAYIDGFGAVTPPAGAVPESATWTMMIAGFGLAGAAMRYRRRKTAVSFG